MVEFTTSRSCMCVCVCLCCVCETVFWKTDLMVTNIETILLPVDESHTHALSRDTKHLRLDGHAVLPFQTAFFQCCKTTRVPN